MIYLFCQYQLIQLIKYTIIKKSQTFYPVVNIFKYDKEGDLK
jgi:hypothetical protein